jgi:hypothetical protein
VVTVQQNSHHKIEQTLVLETPPQMHVQEILLKQRTMRNKKMSDKWGCEIVNVFSVERVKNPTTD